MKNYCIQGAAGISQWLCSSSMPLANPYKEFILPPGTLASCLLKTHWEVQSPMLWGSPAFEGFVRSGNCCHTNYCSTWHQQYILLGPNSYSSFDYTFSGLVLLKFTDLLPNICDEKSWQHDCTAIVQLQFLISQDHVFKVQTNQTTKSDGLRWCYDAKSPKQRGEWLLICGAFF